MNPNSPKTKKMLIDDDISFQSPSMSSKQREDNLAAFGAFRKKAQKEISDEERLKLRFLHLKFQINDFLRGKHADYQFGFFLALYMRCLELNGKTFAEEISIKPSLLSQYIHNQRDPNETIMMRLEIHSNYNFPAALWYEILAQQKSIELRNDTILRKHEEAIVKPKVRVVI